MKALDSFIESKSKDVTKLSSQITNSLKGLTKDLDQYSPTSNVSLQEQIQKGRKLNAVGNQKPIRRLFDEALNVARRRDDVAEIEIDKNTVSDDDEFRVERKVANENENENPINTKVSNVSGIMNNVSNNFLLSKLPERLQRKDSNSSDDWDEDTKPQPKKPTPGR